MAERTVSPTKVQTDKIVAHLGKLNDFELSRISSEIKRIRVSRSTFLKKNMFEAAARDNKRQDE